MFRSTPVVKNIITLNIGVFILQYLTNGTLYDVSNWLSIHHYQADYFYPWQYFTYMFTHSGEMHLFLNMLPIIIFGPYLEKVFGQKKFLLFYLFMGLFSGIATNILHTYQVNHMLKTAHLVKANLNGESINDFVKIVNPAFFADHPEIYSLFMHYISQPKSLEHTNLGIELVDTITTSVLKKPLIGASGAIFALLIAAALYLPNKQLPLIPIPFKWLVLIFVIIEFRNVDQASFSNYITHFIHLSGMFFALLFYMISKRKGFNTSQT